MVKGIKKPQRNTRVRRNSPAFVTNFMAKNSFPKRPADELPLLLACTRAVSWRTSSWQARRVASPAQTCATWSTTRLKTKVIFMGKIVIGYQPPHTLPIL